MGGTLFFWLVGWVVWEQWILQLGFFFFFLINGCHWCLLKNFWVVDLMEMSGWKVETHG